MDEPEIRVLLATLIVSVLSVLFSAYQWFRLRRLELLSISLGKVNEVEQMLVSLPQAFRFHGINLQPVRDKGITDEEFGYLVASFSAGSTYHRLKTRRGKTILGDYRLRMLQVEQVRDVWPELRKML